MSEVILRRRRARAGEIGLFPVDDQGWELIGKLKDNRDVGCTIVQHRNPRHLRLYWAMLKLLSEHTEMFAGKDKEIISIALKLATGLVRTFVDEETGKTVMVPLSISFSSMDQTRFNEFFDAACNTMATRWFPPGTTSESVRDELIRMCDGEYSLKRASS